MTRLFAVSVRVSEKAQKNFGESTHPISNTRSMHMIITFSAGTDGTTHENVPTWDGFRVPQWYASVMSSFGTQTKISSRSASQISWKMCGKALPNSIDSRAITLSMLSLTLGVSLLGGAKKFRIRRGRRWE